MKKHRKEVTAPLNLFFFFFFLSKVLMSRSNSSTFLRSPYIKTLTIPTRGLEQNTLKYQEAQRKKGLKKMHSVTSL